MGLVTLSARQIVIADINTNSSVQVDDSLTILRFAMHLITSF